MRIMLPCSLFSKLLLLSLCAFSHLSVRQNLSASDPLASLSDEFNNSSTLSSWQLLSDVEGWNANQLQTWTIDQSHKGRMLMIPHTSVWFNDWRGILAFKNVTGDFVITTSVESTNRAGTAAPSSQYSLAGIMVRTPRAISSPADWSAGGENYIFLSLGSAGNPGTYQFEVKTTINSNSTLQFENTGGINRSLIQVARIGSHFILLRRLEGGSWTVHRRYHRPDMPQTLQAGLTTYTDWPTSSSYAPFIHNQTVITEGNPDLMAAFEYVRYATPSVPPQFAGRDFSNPASITDGELLTFLGDNANTPSSSLEAWRESTFPDPSTDASRLDSDYDSDGLSNLAEFFFATDPLTPDTLPVSVSASSLQLSIDFRQRKNADGLSFAILTTSALNESWQSPNIQPEVVDDSNGDYQVLRYDLPYQSENSLFASFSLEAN